MKINKFLAFVASVSLLGAMTSCQEKESPTGPVKGTVTGTVTDETGAAIVDVNVKIGELSGVTAADGTYTIKDVPQAKAMVVFTKTGLADASVNINEKSFVDGVATVDAVMEVACARILGRCVSGVDQPAEGINVILNGGAASVTTGSDGTYKFENLTLKDYTLTFTGNDCPTVEKTVAKSEFTAVNEYTVTIPDVNMSAQDVLPGLTLAQLEASAQPWYYNEFRGGRNGDDYPHFDWSTDMFYCWVAPAHYGWLEEQNEGTTIQIRNSENDGHWNNPADLENFDSYIYGRKSITADNCKMYLKVRTHGGLIKWGVMVVDPSAADTKAVRIGEICEYDSDNYTTGSEYDKHDFEFDLSPYIGKEVYIAIGVYRAETGDYWHQLVLRRIVFAKECPTDWGWCPGEEIQELGTNWHMTKEMARSIMPITETKSFTGISEIGADRDSYYQAYGNWRAQKHLMGYWAMAPVHKDTEPFPGEGFLIKTRGDAQVSFTEPEAYIYGKLPIAEGANKMTMRVRGFSTDNATWFRVVAITEDAAVENLVAAEAVSGPHEANKIERINDTYKMISEGGGADTPDDYTKLVFDLSKYNGKNVIIAVATFKGESNGDENKLAFHSIVLE